MKIWKPDFLSEKFYTQAHFANIEEVKNVKFFSLDSWGKFPRTHLIVEPPHPPTDYFTCGPMYVVSEKLMKALAAHPGVQAEFFPLEVIYSGQPYTEANYYCLHVLAGVDCFDFERSKYSVDEDGSVDAIDGLVLDEIRTLGHELFHITNIDFIILCASDQLANQIMTARYTGMRFFDPTELKW